MKSKSRPFLVSSRPAFAALLGLSGSAWAATNNWNTTTGTWDTSTANWSSPATWTNGDDAVFSNTATASTITLSSGLTAGSVVVGNGGNNANYTFTGSGLSATTFTVRGDGGNNLGTNPTAVINNAGITLSGALNIGRAYLNITGNSIVSADTIGSPAGGDGTGAWGSLTIADTASVTATNGFSIGTTAWGLNLNGGTLTTKNLSYSPHSFSGTTNLNFNGTLIKANQDNSNFIVVGPGGLDAGFNPDIQAGGAKFDTNTHTIGIGVALQGIGALTKSGTGTLNLNVANSYSGGTIVNGGTLSLNHEPGGIANTAIGAMTSSNTVTINNGGVLTSNGSTNNWLSSTALASGGGNAISVTVNQGGTLKGGSGRVTGLGNVALNGGTIEVTNGLGAFGWNASFSLGGDITVSGSTASAITTSSGAGTSANIYMSNGSNGTGGTRTFTVNDVTGSAASDLVVSAQLARGTVIKAGAGTLELAAGATGTETPVGWQVNNGKLLVNANVTTGGVSVGSGGTLAGSGTVGATTVDGTFAPGNSIGTLSIGGTLDLNGTSIFEIDPTLGIGLDRAADLATTSGTISYGGTLNVLYSGLSSDFTNGMVFNLFDATSFTDSFSTINLPTLGGGLTWENNLGTNGTLVVVPEPGAALLGGLGLLALLRRRRA
jgi:autotransporter-associated beta strand protein